MMNFLDSFLEKRILEALVETTTAQRDCFFVTLKNFMLLTDVPTQKIKLVFQSLPAFDQNGVFW